MGGEWTQLPLASVAWIHNGKRPPCLRKQPSETCNIPVFGGGGITGYTNRPLYETGVLVTGRVGTLGQLYAADGPCWPSDNTLVIWPRDPNLDGVYLRYALHRVIPYVRRMNRGAANPLITKGDIGRLLLPYPPLTEQRAIAHILGTLDDKIELNHKMNHTLEAMARALFKSWFVDFDPVRAKAQGRRTTGMDAETAALFPDAFEDSELGPIPRGWRVEPIGEVVRVVGGTTPSTKNPLYWEGGRHCWTTPKDLTRNDGPILLRTARRITDEGLSKISSGLLPRGTFLLSSRAPVGYTAITAIPVAVNQGYIAVPPGGRLPSSYLYFWAHFNMGTIKARAGGTTFQEISKRDFRPIPLVVPPVDLVHVYDSAVQPLFRRMEGNERESGTLAAMRDTLLPKLLSGEIRVRDAERFVEKTL